MKIWGENVEDLVSIFIFIIIISFVSDFLLSVCVVSSPCFPFTPDHNEDLLVYKLMAL